MIPAGRELNELVATHVMKLEVVRTYHWPKTRPQAYVASIGEPDYYDVQGDMILHNPLPDYSEDIAAAWEVVEKLNLLDFHYLWKEVDNYVVGVPADGIDNTIVYGKAPTVAHAICLAALEAVGFPQP